MKNLLAIGTVCLGLTMSGCVDEMVSTHGPKNFNDGDRWAISVVEKSPLGKLSTLREVVSGAVLDTEPLESCQYSVEKWAERSKGKIDGEYRYYYRVFCLTSTSKSPDIHFIWDVDDSEFGVVAFRWEWAGVE